MRERNSQKSKLDILEAAEKLFAEKGIYGTRVDEIAKEANINKRMIYEYFGNKEELYREVLVSAYRRLGTLELDILSENMSPSELIQLLIKMYFGFLRDHPTYVSLIQWENLNKGKYIQETGFSGIKDPTLELLRDIMEKGKKQGVFRNEVDTEQVIISLLTYCFSYFSNRYTLSKLLSRQLDDMDNINKRIEHVTNMFLSYLCK